MRRVTELREEGAREPQLFQGRFFTRRPATREPRAPGQLQVVATPTHLPPSTTLTSPSCAGG